MLSNPGYLAEVGESQWPVTRLEVGRGHPNALKLVQVLPFQPKFLNDYDRLSLKRAVWGPAGFNPRSHSIFHLYAPPLVTSSVNTMSIFTASLMTHISTFQSNIATLHKRPSELKHWMANNFIQLNLSKSHVIVFGPTSSMDAITANHGELAPFTKSSTRNLCVVSDWILSFKPLAWRLCNRVFII